MSQSEILQIDTKGICILCYKCVEILGQANQAKLSSSQGFKLLLRYLNVNPRELFNCSEDFLESMDMSVNIDLQINLCSDCSLVTQTFDQLYKDYELIQLRFDDCVRSIHKSMKTGDLCSERVREYKRQMQPYLSTQLVNASIAANLRKETFKKCAAKLKGSIPHVTIPKHKNDPVIPNAHTVDIDIDTNPRSSTLLESTKFQRRPSKNISNNVINDIQDVDVEDSLSSADDEISNDGGDDCLPSNNDINTALLSSISDHNLESPTVVSENICEICNGKFASKNILIRHRATVHMGQLIYNHFPFKSPMWTVQNCTETAKSYINEIISTNTLKGAPNYKCCYCSSILAKRDFFKTHLLCTHIDKFYDQIRRILRMQPDTLQEPKTVPIASDSGPEVQERCHICMKTFDSLQLLLEHLCIQHFQNQAKDKNPSLHRKIQCQGCETQFSTLGSFQKHMLMVHTLESVLGMLPPSICRDQCGTAVDSVLEWISSIGSQCPHCDFTFPHLKGHILGEHLKEFVDQVQEMLKSIDTKEDGENVADSQFQSQEDLVEIEDEEMKMEIESHSDTDPLA